MPNYYIKNAQQAEARDLPPKHWHLVKAAIRITVALRDWGPLSLHELQADVRVSEATLISVLELLRKGGWVKRVSRSGKKLFFATEKAMASDGGYRFFGYPSHRWYPYGKLEAPREPAVPNFSVLEDAG